MHGPQQSCVDCGKRFDAEFDEDGHAQLDRCPHCEQVFIEWSEEGMQSA